MSTHPIHHPADLELDIDRGNILVVDDTPANLHLLTKLLSDNGYTVRSAPQGRMALKSIQLMPPDLILLDILMPEINGYSICQILKADPHTAHIPIIFISALDEELDKVKAFASGAADYITKPFQTAEVLARIDHHLQIQRLQRQLMERNALLERSNQELEQFAHVVSHDLQQPLQSMTGFIDLVKLEYHDCLDRQVLVYLDRVAQAGHRMQELIQNLLIYAQVDKHDRQWDWVDCNTILQTAIDNLQEAIATTQATLTYAPLPTVAGNKTQLVQLFQNLIGNALKFVKPATPPRIQISVNPEEKYWRFGIHDNGIGIAAADTQRVFRAFERLHESKIYPGTGLGLAICQKIVEHHQGQIWVESPHNAGTSFYFRLPKQG